ncbi:hypothetical protein J0H58_37945, partial [bacterium]|nr:hypothetical protein [bacterium]
MTRTCTALAPLLTLVAAVPAQPPAPPPALRPFGGVSPDQFRNSTVARWADQIGLDLGTLKAAASAPQVPPPTRAAVGAAADRAAGEAAAVARAARRAADRRAEVAHENLDRELARLTALVRQDPAARAAAGPALARVRYADQQLEAALAEGDRDPARLRAAVVRLADSLEDQADALRDLIADRGGFDPATVQAVRGLAGAARQFGRAVRYTGDLDAARRDYRTTLA